jgi:16S rRNA (cytosine1402-N4)-methyltransferase
MAKKNLFHQPVFKEKILAFLLFEKVQTIFDGTLGLGGHAEAILTQFPQVQQYIACDLDQEHLTFAKKKLHKWHNKILFYHTNFSSIKKIVQKNDIPRPLIIMLDLGLCSNHIDCASKGFSFEVNGPLQMTFGQTQKRNCADIISTFSEKQLIRILQEYGEEPFARKIARNIIQERERTPIKMTLDLRKIIESSVNPRYRKKSLMRVFQAFRIMVNDELNVLKKTLVDALKIMQKGDRMGIISYHSLEDRIVKHFFITASKPKTTETEFSLYSEIEPAQCRLITRKPIIPSPEEITENSRSRSAKLRILEKL